MFAVISSLRITRDQQQAISRGSADFITINEQQGTVVALQGHFSGVEVRRWMFGHHHEIELVGLRSRNDVCEVAGAVAAEK